jgi:hypothetical protein
MGVLARYTRSEIERRVASDPRGWPELGARVAEHGSRALQDERRERGWSWGALWAWLTEDEERYREYRRALEGYAQMRMLETVPIADESGDARLRVETRFKFAERADPARWSVKGGGEGGAVKVVLVNFRLQDGRVVEAE